MTDKVVGQSIADRLLAEARCYCDPLSVAGAHVTGSVTGSVRRSAGRTRSAALCIDTANRRCARATDMASLYQSLKFGISIKTCSMRARCRRDFVIKYNWKSGHFLSSSSISSRFAIARSNGVSIITIDPNHRIGPVQRNAKTEEMFPIFSAHA